MQNCIACHCVVNCELHQETWRGREREGHRRLGGDEESRKLDEVRIGGGARHGG